MLGPALLWLVLQEKPSPRLVLEDLEGVRTELAPSALPLEDPRQKGAWIVRPVDYPAVPERGAGAGTSVRVTLVNGDELRARVIGGEGEVLRLELVGGVVVPFELETLKSLEFPEQIPADEVLALGPASEGDRLYRRAGDLDAIDGTLEGFEADGVCFDSVLGLRTIPWAEVGALFIETLEPAGKTAREERVPVVVSFAGTGGGRVRGGLLAIERERCRIVLGGKTEVALPLFAISELQVADGRLTFLSELEPTGESGRGAPFGDELGMSWPHRMDQNALGGELRAGGLAYRRGIGMHAPGTLTFALEPGYRSLRGRVAIDDSALVNPLPARGSAVFRLRADGEVLWESALVRGGDPPLSIPALALSGKKELVLEVDPAGDFAGDRADWLELILIR
jgi:hypothetical protein